MQVILKLWGLLMNLIANIVNYLELLSESLAKYKCGRFFLGSIFGLISVTVYWGYSTFFRVDISLIQGITGSLILMLAFGLAAVYGKLGQLIDGFNL